MLGAIIVFLLLSLPVRCLINANVLRYAFFYNFTQHFICWAACLLSRQSVSFALPSICHCLICSEYHSRELQFNRTKSMCACFVCRLIRFFVRSYVRSFVSLLTYILLSISLYLIAQCFHRIHAAFAQNIREIQVLVWSVWLCSYYVSFFCCCLFLWITTRNKTWATKRNNTQLYVNYAKTYLMTLKGRLMLPSRMNTCVCVCFFLSFSFSSSSFSVLCFFSVPIVTNVNCRWTQDDIAAAIITEKKKSLSMSKKQPYKIPCII